MLLREGRLCLCVPKRTGQSPQGSHAQHSKRWTFLGRLHVRAHPLLGQLLVRVTETASTSANDHKNPKLGDHLSSQTSFSPGETGVNACLPSTVTQPAFRGCSSTPVSHVNKSGDGDWPGAFAADVSSGVGRRLLRQARNENGQKETMNHKKRPHGSWQKRCPDLIFQKTPRVTQHGDRKRTLTACPQAPVLKRKLRGSAESRSSTCSCRHSDHIRHAAEKVTGVANERLQNVRKNKSGGHAFTFHDIRDKKRKTKKKRRNKNTNQRNRDSKTVPNIETKYEKDGWKFGQKTVYKSERALGSKHWRVRQV